jgi:hypothetical protein
MEKDVLQAVRYFHQFSYPPSAGEIHMFLRRKASQKKVAAILAVLVKNRKLQAKMIENSARYTIGGYSINFSKYRNRTVNSKLKIKNSKLFINLLSFFPQIRLIGLSGSVSMMNADRKDDVDIFIISGRGRIWTARFLSLLVAQTLGIRRKRGEMHTKNKICLNLLFDEERLEVPNGKKNEYVAHEVLQVKPVINKAHIYERFLRRNKWVFDIFPNAFDILRPSLKGSIKVHRSRFTVNGLGDGIEWLLKCLQLFLIRRHQTTELITNHQLWFHPDDFQRKVTI